MKIPTMLLTPEESRDRGGVLTPTITGPIREVAGRYGKAWKTEEATTNYITNPRTLTTATSTTNFDISYENEEVSHPSGITFPGYRRTVVKVPGTNIVAYAVAGTSPLAQNQAWSGQYLVRLKTASYTGKFVRMLMWESGGVSAPETVGFGDVQASALSDGKWHLVSGSGVIKKADRTSMAIYAQLFNGAAGDVFECVAFQAEARSYATSYTDGSLGSGYAWTGVANASTSTRAASQYLTSLSRSPFAAKRGTVIVRAKYHKSSHDVASQYAVSLIVENTSTIFGLGRWPSEHLSYPRMEAFSAGNGAARNPIIPDDTFVTHGVRMFPHPTDPNYAGWFYRGHLIDGSETGDASFPLGHDLTTFNLYRLGYTGVLRQNLELESAIFFDETLTAAEYNEIASFEGRWKWENFMPRIGGMIRTSVADEVPVGAVSRVTHEQLPASPTSIGTPVDYLYPLDGDTAGITPTGTEPALGSGPRQWIDNTTGLLVEDATTNYVHMPYTGHTFGYSNVSVSLIYDAGAVHPKNQVLINTGSRTTVAVAGSSSAFLGYNVSTMPVPQGQDYTWSLMLKASPGFVGKEIRFQSMESGGATAAYYNTQVIPVIMTGDWQYVTYTSKIRDTDRTHLYFYGSITGSQQAVGDYIDVTARQCEAKAWATSICPVLLNDDPATPASGYAWTGVTNNSPSTREYTTVYGPFLNQNKGAVAVKFHQGVGHPNNGYLFSSGGTSNSFISVGLYSNKTTKPVLYIDGVNYQHLFPTNYAIPDKDVTVILEWDGPTMSFHTSAGDSTTVTIPDNRPAPSSQIRLGTYGATFFSNALFKAVAIFEGPLRPSERTKLFNNEDWTWDELETRVGGAIRSSFRDVPQLEATASPYPEYTPEPSLVSTIPILALPLKNSLEGNGRAGIVTPLVGSGPVRYTPKSLLTEEVTINYIRNPSAEVNLIGIAAISSAVVTRDTTTAYSGVASAKVVTDGTIVYQGIQYGTLTSLGLTGPRTITGSVYLKGSGEVRVWTRITYTDATTTEGTHVASVLTPDWKRFITVPTAADPAKTINHIQFFIRTPYANASAITFWADAAQVEDKAFATTYTDGSLGEGYAWSGVAHDSASTRARSTIRVMEPGYSPVQGAIAVRGSWLTPSTTNAGLCGQFGNNANRIYVIRHATDKHLYMGAGTNAFLIKGPLVTEGVTYTVIAEWNNGVATLHVNGVTYTPIAYGGLTEVFPFSIGTTDGVSNPLNGEVGPVVVFERPLTATERANLFAAESWDWQKLLPSLASAVVRAPVTEPIIVTRTSPVLI